MFNLVVLCSLVAVASAGGIAPLVYSSAVVSPFTATFSSEASSVIHPSPPYVPLASSYGYGSPHFLKKRSVAWAPSIIAPSTYITRTPLVTSYAAPLATTYSVATPLAATIASPLYGAHLIKKRSLAVAAFAPAAVSHQSRVDIKSTPAVTYTSYATPLTYAATPVISTPIVSAAPVLSTPFGYSHFIKKRSPSLAVASYIAPAAVSHQSRVDIKSTPAIAYTSYSAPLAYASPVISTPVLSSPFGYSHFIKKRSPSLAVAAYVAPSAVSHQSRVDFRSTPAITTYSSYAAPWAYSSPLISHVY